MSAFRGDAIRTGCLVSFFCLFFHDDNGDNDDNDDDNKDDDDDTVGQLVYHKICFRYVSMTHILHIFSR